MYFAVQISCGMCTKKEASWAAVTNQINNKNLLNYFPVIYQERTPTNVESAVLYIQNAFYFTIILLFLGTKMSYIFFLCKVVESN